MVVDHGNHCLRQVERGGEVSDFVGHCKAAGYVDGVDAYFKYPWSVLIDQRQPGHLLVLDGHNFNVRLVSMTTRIATTLTSLSGTGVLSSFSFDCSKKNLIIHYAGRMVFYDLITKVHTVIAGSVTKGYKDGNLSEAQFWGLKGAVCIKPDLYIVADKGNNRLQVIDIAKGAVSSICTGTGNLVNGDVTTCGLNQPQGLLMLNAELYVGIREAVVKFNRELLIHCLSIAMKTSAADTCIQCRLAGAFRT